MEIKLRAGECRSEADAVQTASADALDIIQTLRTRLDGLSDSFTGKTHDAFITKVDELSEANNQMMTALDGLGQFLKAAADTIEQVDTDLAAQLQG